VILVSQVKFLFYDFLKIEISMLPFFRIGYLINSIAKTIEAGCKPYMAPERIDPQGNPSQYDVRSDVWSFGISMIEISTGRFPYSKWSTPFEQLKQVVAEPAPQLPGNRFSQTYEEFINLTYVLAFKKLEVTLF
jgi:mitogen-activated protein kinase kinase 3